MVIRPCTVECCASHYAGTEMPPAIYLRPIIHGIPSIIPMTYATVPTGKNASVYAVQATFAFVRSGPSLLRISSSPTAHVPAAHTSSKELMTKNVIDWPISSHDPANPSVSP